MGLCRGCIGYWKQNMDTLNFKPYILNPKTQPEALFQALIPEAYFLHILSSRSPDALFPLEALIPEALFRQISSSRSP